MKKPIQIIVSTFVAVFSVYLVVAAWTEPNLSPPNGNVGSMVNHWTLSGSDLYPNLTAYMVGIGTTDPAEKLEVSGNIKLTGATPTYKLLNLAAPTSDSDAATKAYVDGAGGGTPSGWTCTLRTSGCMQSNTATASCSGSEKVIAGGGAVYTNNQCNTFNSSYVVAFSFPTDQGWTVGMLGSAYMKAYANCCY